MTPQESRHGIYQWLESIGLTLSKKQRKHLSIMLTAHGELCGKILEDDNQRLRDCIKQHRCVSFY